MTKQIASKIFYGAFILVFVIFVGIMIFGMISDKKEEEKKVSAYQQMINEGSKTVLTNEILDEDHDQYVQDTEKAKKTFLTLAACFGAIAVIFLAMVICSTIIKGMEDGPGIGLTVSVVSFIAVTFMITSFAVIAIKAIVPHMKYSNPDKEAYYFETLSLKDCKTEKEVIETNTGGDRETRTVIHYILIDDNGKEIETNKVLYERFVGEGEYYAGKTVGGYMFSLYPEVYFELAE